MASKGGKARWKDIPADQRSEAMRAVALTRRAKKSERSEFASKGGKARAEKLTPEQRKRIARKGARAMWARKRKAVNKDDAPGKNSPKGKKTGNAGDPRRNARDSK